MKTIRTVSVAVLCALNTISAFAVKTVEWNPAGSGGWADGSRWKDSSVPEAGDSVKVSGCTAVVESVDFALAASMTEIVLVDEAVLAFDLDDTAAKHVFNTVKVSGSGTVLKDGEGTLVWGASGEQESYYKVPSPDKGFVVLEGEMAFTGNAGPVTVNAPGRIRPREDNNFSCYGLYGDGYVTNDVVKQFWFSGGSAASPATFSGKFLCKIDLTLYNGYQYLENAAAAPGANGDIRLWDGVVGVKSFGKCGAAGSLGGTKTIWCRGDPLTVLYLGEGETTDHEFKFNTDSGEITLDAGASGAVVFNGNITASAGSSKMSSLVLSGDNASPCTVNGSISEDNDETGYVHSTHVTKRGKGTWNFAGTSRGLHGAISVENGCLGFDSIAETGTDCALGYSDRLYSAHVGNKDVAPDPSLAVPWAFKIGDGTAFGSGAALAETSATLEYRGTDAVSVLSRSVALSGAGRVRNDTGVPFTFHGVTSAGPGDHALVLDASGGNNLVRHVTNGAGRVSVVKEGAGSWTVSGEMDFGAVEVRGGELELKTSESFSYYRFSVMETYSADNEASDAAAQIYAFVFTDSSGETVSGDLQYRKCIGNAVPLHPGEVTDLHPFSITGTSSYNPRGRVVENMFTNLDVEVVNRYDVIWSGSVGGKRATLGDESTWAGFVCRLPAGHAPVAAYDFRGGTIPYYAETGKHNNRETKSWKLEGSLDGVNWVPLHSVVSNDAYVTGKLCWYSSNTYAFQGGFPIDTVVTHENALTGPISVRVDAGALLRADGGVTADRLIYDAGKGGGTLTGVVFSQGCSLEVVAAPERFDGDLTLLLDKCEGAADFSSWLVSVNGVPLANMRIKRTATGLALKKADRFSVHIR